MTNDSLDYLNYCDATDISEILSEAHNQSVFPIVYDAVKDYARIKLPGNEFKRFENTSYILQAEAIRNLNSHCSICNLLNNNGIKTVVIKGYASSLYYADPLLRNSGDVDILVRPEDFVKVESLLLTNGYDKCKNADKHRFHCAYSKGRNIFEIHFQIPGVPKDDVKISKIMSSVFDDSLVVSTQQGVIPVPSILHHGIILLLHMLSHLTSTGVGIRHLCDWLFFEESISDDNFITILKQPLMDIGLFKFAVTLTRIGELFFGCNNHSWCVDYDDSLCVDLLEDILSSGNFGIKDDGKNKIESKFVKNIDTRKIEKRCLLKNAFTNVNSILRSRYKVFNKTPLLLPFGWLIISFEFLNWIIKNKKCGALKNAYLEATRKQNIYSKLRLFESDLNIDKNGEQDEQ